MRTVFLIKLKDDLDADWNKIEYPEYQILAEKLHDAKRAYLEHLGLDDCWYNDPNGWKYEQELNIHSDYDFEG